MTRPKFERDALKNQKPDIPDEINSLQEYKAVCASNGITNSILHRQKYKEVPGLLAHPERKFKNEWVSYKDTFGVPEYYPYAELKMMVLNWHVSSQAEYKSYARDLNDERVPIDPQGVYGHEWENWYKFLGKEEPYQVKYISQKYKVWAEKITKFMTVALGGKTKLSLLCRFVRIYIERHDKSETPEAFLTQQKVNLKPLKQELEGLDTDNMRRNMILAVNEFLDFVLDNDLTDEDDETGEIIRVMGARNPLALLTTEQSVTNPQRSESAKPCLQYYFVRKAQDWIIPKCTTNFRELRHIQVFDSDWFAVDKSFIDRQDPDCVFKKVGNQFYIWSPISWLHTYTLTKVPLRGRQIAYNDSGEADLEIPDICENGHLVWKKNNSPFAGLTKDQSFVRKLSDSQVGMYITTNKTNNKVSDQNRPFFFS